ncbi:hypothetical protein BaRGS_00018230 [Batillaria attramentaria]|uniref:MARVEL domain-containing protein n=1 Tax=Batillaria attramentaria TaxID=370345 RepID=A0ABD0KT75_9CAEN
MAAVNPRRFLVPANAIRIVELLCAILALASVAGWSSKGITYKELNSHDFNVLGNINFFIAMAVISLIFLTVNVALVLFNKRLIPPKVDLPCCLLLGVLVLLSSVILGVSLAQLGSSTAVKEAGLSFHSMEAGLAFGFIGSACLVCSTWFAFRARMIESDIPVEQTRSIADLPGDIPT